MISATLYFENGINIASLVNRLRQLPEEIRPIYFSEDEGKVVKSNLLSDTLLFTNFLKENELGFFLHSKNKTLIDISTYSVGNASLTVYLKSQSNSELLSNMFKCLAKEEPLFGYAGDEDEYKHRNRYSITIGKNHIEDWVGRKFDKYLSGVYWYTLLSNESIDKHRISLLDLSAEAVSVETLNAGSLHLLKFYEGAEMWRENADRLDSLCEKTDGVFSRRSVQLAVQGVKNYMEYDDIIANWR